MQVPSSAEVDALREELAGLNHLIYALFCRSELSERQKEIFQDHFYAVYYDEGGDQHLNSLDWDETPATGAAGWAQYQSMFG